MKLVDRLTINLMALAQSLTKEKSMAHFAKLDENNNVIGVYVVNNDVTTIDGVELEQLGIDFLTHLHSHALWKQTSYNNNIRKQYAGIGFTYNAVNDVFIAPQPYPSWLLDQNFDWQAPKPRPNKGEWYWDEKNLMWQSLEN
jgi:hypothetical protein